MPTLRALRSGVLAAIAVAIAGCAHAPATDSGGFAWRQTPTVTSTTLALWSFDENTGLTFADSGLARRDGVLGLDTRVEFGRFRNARQFTPSINSFALVRGNRAPALGATWTIEAWIQPSDFGVVECNVIAARWTELANEQSWMLGLTGLDHTVVTNTAIRPDLFTRLIPRREVGLLVFVYRPQEAGEPRALLSTLPVERNRWTHVAVASDGHELRMYIDGRLDAQFATVSRVRDVDMPLVIGNLIDPRWLTESQGSMRVPDDSLHYPFYAFVGLIDELRISGSALGPGH